MSRNLKIAVGILSSLLIIYFISVNLNLGEVGYELRGANYFWLVPNIILIIGSMYLRAWRWKIMLNPICNIDFRKVLSSTSIGFMANNILPLRLGEVVRSYSLSKQEKNISNSSILATIFSERIIFDLLALLILFSLIFRITSLTIPDELVGASYVLMFPIIFGIIFSLGLVLFHNFIILFIKDNLPFVSDKIKNIIIDILSRVSLGLKFSKDLSSSLLVLFQTILIWSLVAISNYFIFLAFNLNLPIEAAFSTLIIVSVMVILPSAPGFIGIYHAGVKLTLEQYGVSTEISVACSIIMHASQYLVVTSMGFYYMWKTHLSLTDIRLGMK